MASGNLTVLALDEEKLTYITSRNGKTPREMAVSDLLRRLCPGDDGDTLKNTQRMKEKKMIERLKAFAKEGPACMRRWPTCFLG